jgi:CRISPR-associated protein Cas1
MGTLYLTEQGAIITKTDGRIVVRKDGQVLQDVPAIEIDQIVVFGNVGFTTPAIKFVLDHGIDVAYLSSRGMYRGRLVPHWSKDGPLRRQQFERASDAGFCLAVSKDIVLGKLHNSVAFCRRQRRRDAEVDAFIRRAEALASQVTGARTLDEIRGYEGAGSAAYYRVLRKYLKYDLGFQRRIAHPPPDPVNILLSLGYTLLYNHLYAAINIVGLDPYQGFFHQPKRGHAALASDLVEEWRAVIVDSVVLTVINSGEIRAQDFQESMQGLRLSRDALVKFLKRFDARVAEEVFSPTTNYRTSYRRHFELQVRHMARVILVEDSAYQPFKIR